MRTLTKVLLLVFWLLGAGSGFAVPEPSPADDYGHYRYTLMEGVNVSVQSRLVTLRVEHRVAPRSFALTVSVPSWVAALSHHQHALTASSEAMSPGSSS